MSVRNVKPIILTQSRVHQPLSALNNLIQVVAIADPDYHRRHPRWGSVSY